MADSSEDRSTGETTETAGYDFGGATFDLSEPRDREIVRFVLSQALFGEATGVYCGRSLYAARSLEAARFYLRQARQELGHLQLFADIFRELDLEPMPGHIVMRSLASHNDYYPLKVLMEHAIGEGLVLDVFRDLLMQTLPDSDPRIPGIKKKLGVICREEAEHVSWGEKETTRLLREQPWLEVPYYGIVEIQLALLPLLLAPLRRLADGHPVLSQMDAFLAHASDRVRAQARRLGFAPTTPPSRIRRLGAMTAGIALYARGQFARSRSVLDRTYLRELGFE